MKIPATVLLMIIASLVTTKVIAHEEHQHETSLASIALTADEQIALPNLPVTDRFNNSMGFRDSLPATDVLLLSFTYTACDTLCDISNALLQVVDKGLGTGPDRDGTIVTVAIDSVRDTPQTMRETANKLQSSDHWLWFTGGPRGTRPLLESLRFPAGALEDHDPMFLVGRACHGSFTRVVGLANPSALLDLVKAQPPCES